MISRYTLAVSVFGIFLVTLGGTSVDGDSDGDDSGSEDTETDTVCIEVIITDSSE